MTHQETPEWIAQGVPNALARCQEHEELGRNLPACPPNIFRDCSERIRQEQDGL